MKKELSLKEEYTKEDIKKNIKIAPLPHPFFILLCIDDNFKNHYKKIQQKTYKEDYILKFINTIKIFNKANLKHQKEENALALSHDYLKLTTGDFHIKKKPYFKKLFKKVLHGYKPLIKVYDDKYIADEYRKGYTNAYERRVEPKSNIAYTSIENAIKIIDNYIQTNNIEEYVEKYNYYASKKRKSEDIIIEELLQNIEKQKELKKENKITLKLKKENIEAPVSTNPSFKEKTIDEEIQILHLPGINKAIKDLSKIYTEKLISYEEKLKEYSLNNNEYIKYKKLINHYKRNIRDLNTLSQYIDEKENLHIIRNVKEGIDRDYHFITYFSKQLRKDLFEDRLGFQQYDVSNMAYKAISSIFRFEPIKIKAIDYYAYNRDKIFTDGFKDIGIEPRSFIARDLKPLLKIEFLAILMGKRKFSISLPIPKEDYQYTYFYQMADWIIQDRNDLKKYILSNKDRFEKDFNVKLNERNCISNLFMKVESLIMNEISNVLIPRDLQFFRLHDAIYIQNFYDESIMNEIKKIVNSYIENRKTGNFFYIAAQQGSHLYNSFKDENLDNFYYDVSVDEYSDWEELQIEFERIYEETKRNRLKNMEENRRRAEEIRKSNNKIVTGTIDSIDKMYLYTLEKDEHIKSLVETRLGIELIGEYDLKELKGFLLSDKSDMVVENLKKSYRRYLLKEKDLIEMLIPEYEEERRLKEIEETEKRIEERVRKEMEKRKNCDEAVEDDDKVTAIKEEDFEIEDIEEFNDIFDDYKVKEDDEILIRLKDNIDKIPKDLLVDYSLDDIAEKLKLMIELRKMQPKISRQIRREIYYYVKPFLSDLIEEKMKE